MSPLGSIPVHGNAFGSTNSSTPILLDDLVCIGRESSLLNCSHAPLGMSDCTSEELAGVRCEGNDNMNE